MSETDTPPRPNDAAIPLTRRSVIIFSVVVTALFLILFLVVTIYLRKQSLQSVFETGRPLIVQILTGLLLGITIAVIALFVLFKAGFLARLRAFISEILGQIRPTTFDLILVSVFAGVGEELFFRATLQPFMRLWLASLIFALAHTGFPMKRATLAFAAYVFVMGVLLGILYEQVGLIAAIVMHAVYDLIFLLAVKRQLRLRNAD